MPQRHKGEKVADTKLPWDSGDVVVSEDNVMFSRLRYDAIKAMKNGSATPNQAKLVMDTDKVMAEAMASRRK